MRDLLLRVAFNSLALWLMTQIYSGVFFAPGSGLSSYLLAGLILGFVNALLRPILLVFTFPINVLSLGLFTLVINGLVLSVVASLTSLELRSFGAAVVGAIVLSLVSFGLNMLIGPKRNPR